MHLFSKAYNGAWLHRLGWQMPVLSGQSHSCRNGSLVQISRISPLVVREAYSTDTVNAASRIRRQSLSQFWIPAISGRLTLSSLDQIKTSELLERCGFLYQGNAGIFHLLPLGLRIQDKLERLVDKHMKNLGASRLSLSSLSPVSLWKESERYDEVQAELFKLQDRKTVPFLLAPTHEEEITRLVGRSIQSYRDLPLRLFQISRKYRDEKRPREGLLRAREFLMKDLYTFDICHEDAVKAYDEVRTSYDAFFEELRLPFFRAKASSGTMGGSLSHEYHLESPKGEDEIIVCQNCHRCENTEIAKRRETQAGSRLAIPASILVNDEHLADNSKSDTRVRKEFFLSKDGRTLIAVVIPDGKTAPRVNAHEVKRDCDFDTAIENALPTFQRKLIEHPEEEESFRVLYILDHSLEMQGPSPSFTEISLVDNSVSLPTQVLNSQRDLVSIADGDTCSHCNSPALQIKRSIELGHTFHLGDRYSQKLGVKAATNASGSLQSAPRQYGRGPSSLPDRVALEMGCHGIGLSRLIPAVADTLRDSRGLRWPRKMAPFDVVILPVPGHLKAANEVYDILTSGSTEIDCIIDDQERRFGPMIKDAELLGYPVIIVVGEKWALDTPVCDVQYRTSTSTSRTSVAAGDVYSTVQNILDDL